MRETPLRQRYTAMLRHLMRSRIHPALASFADAYCDMLAHSAYLGVLAVLAIVGTRLRDELLEKTETYRTFRHPGREDVRRWAPATRKSGCGARNAAWPPAIPEKSRHLGQLRSGAPAKVLVFMQLFRLPPHYVMRCGPIDLVTMYPRRLR